MLCFVLTSSILLNLWCVWIFLLIQPPTHETRNSRQSWPQHSAGTATQNMHSTVKKATGQIKMDKLQDCVYKNVYHGLYMTDCHEWMTLPKLRKHNCYNTVPAPHLSAYITSIWQWPEQQTEMSWLSVLTYTSSLPNAMDLTETLPCPLLP